MPRNAHATLKLTTTIVSRHAVISAHTLGFFSTAWLLSSSWLWTRYAYMYVLFCLIPMAIELRYCSIGLTRDLKLERRLVQILNNVYWYFASFWGA
jgi:ABC-type amino acid transport system permease subunit